jgi:hypothetical protein
MPAPAAQLPPKIDMDITKSPTPVVMAEQVAVVPTLPVVPTPVMATYSSSEAKWVN